jgi:hypothetical protein
VTAHLQEVAQALRGAPTSPWTLDQQRRRASLLDALESYTAAGQYPHNHSQPAGRTPVFVDAHGSHCAVGYLLAVDGREDLVRAAVAQDREGLLHELVSPALADWADGAGFTLDELARIQPSYGFMVPEEDPEEELRELERALVAADDCLPLWSSREARRWNHRDGWTLRPEESELASAGLGVRSLRGFGNGNRAKARAQANLLAGVNRNPRLILSSGPATVACLEGAEGQNNSVEVLLRMVQQVRLDEAQATTMCTALERSLLKRRARALVRHGICASESESWGGVDALREADDRGNVQLRDHRSPR